MFRANFNPWREVERSKPTYFSYFRGFLHAILVMGLCGHLAYIAFPPPPLDIREQHQAFLEALPADARPLFEKVANITEDELNNYVRNWNPLLEGVKFNSAGNLNPIMQMWIQSYFSFAMLNLMSLLPLSILAYAIRVANVLFWLMVNDFALLALYNNRSGHAIFIHIAGVLHVLESLILACTSLVAYIRCNNKCIATIYPFACVYLLFMGALHMKAARLTFVNSSQFQLEKSEFQEWEWFKLLKRFKPLGWFKLLRPFKANSPDEEEAVGLNPPGSEKRRKKEEHIFY